jgi:CRISPR-associated protein Csm5
MKRYKMKLQILSPVHIGTGYQIPPYEYVVDKKNHRFYRIDLYKFLSSMDATQRAVFERAVNQSNPTFARKFIAENVDVEKYSLYRCTTNDDFEKRYNEKMDDIRNQLLVDEIPRQQNDQRPYLPGSGIKGAIRTAVVSQYAAEKNFTRVGNPRYFEKDLFGYKDAKQDPFRCVKITDAPLKDKLKVFVSGAENFNPNKEGSESIQMFCEQIYSLLDDEPEVYAEAEVAFDDELPSKSYIDRKEGRQKAVTMAIDSKKVIKDCKDFYKPKIVEEYDKFYKNGPDAEYIQPLLEVKFADNEFPIRVGHFSHCECVTVDKLRMPRTRKGRDGRPLPWGKTRTLSNGVPFGWVKVALEDI